jgi:hypothetical protein
MTSYNVYLRTTADFVVRVDVDDEGLSIEEAHDRAMDAAFDEAPSGVCAQCSGWRQSWSLDLNDWEPIDQDPVEKAER